MARVHIEKTWRDNLICLQCLARSQETLAFHSFSAGKNDCLAIFEVRSTGKTA